MINEIDWDEHNRQLVLDGRAALERTAQSISRSNQVAAETETIGTEVISELSAQRETLLRTKGRLTNADEQLDTTRNLLRKMTRNVLYNKLILVLIIILELCILITLTFLRFRHKF